MPDLCQSDRLFLAFSGTTRNERHRKSNENNSYKKISKAEINSIQEIEIAWGGSELSASSIVGHARKLYKIREQIRKNVKKIISI